MFRINRKSWLSGSGASNNILVMFVEVRQFLTGLKQLVTIAMRSDTSVAISDRI